VYAGGRPLWHLSIAQHHGGRTVPVSRWDRSARKRAERIRDSIFATIGTSEPIIEDRAGSILATHWRKPLAIAEINRLAPTPDVRRREGRP
jgi:hypothetical protein